MALLCCLLVVGSNIQISRKDIHCLSHARQNWPAVFSADVGHDEIGVQVCYRGASVGGISEADIKCASADAAFLRFFPHELEQFAPCGRRYFSDGFNMFFVDKEKVVLGAFVWIHIVREYPEASCFNNRLFMVLRQILRTKRTHAVLLDFLYDIFVFAIRSRAGVLQIDE